MSEDGNANRHPPRHPFCRQFIAITPRSGSMWWCELLRLAGLGRPAEFLNEQGRFRRLYSVPDPALNWPTIHAELARPGKRRAYDLKASWFQVQAVLTPALEQTLATDGFPRTVWSYLTRGDLAAQALSLYLMRRLRIAHSRKNDAPLQVAPAWLEPSGQNHAALMCWLLHIVQQEHGWETFFARHSIQPWRCTYEEMARRPALQAFRYARHARQQGARHLKLPLSRARQSARRCSLEKRTYPDEATSIFLASFRTAFAPALAVIEAHRGREPAASLQRMSGLRGLDKSEMQNL